MCIKGVLLMGDVAIREGNGAIFVVIWEIKKRLSPFFLSEESHVAGLLPLNTRLRDK